MANRKVDASKAAYKSRGKKLHKAEPVGVPVAYELGDASCGNDGSKKPATPPASGKKEPGAM